MTIKERNVAERRSSAPSEDVIPVASAEAIPMVEATPLGEPLSSPIAMPVTEAIIPPKTVRVMSPMTLPEGATFKAVVDGIEFDAIVPRGGVREGEIFETAYPRTIRVMAPETLSAGDRFEAAVDGVRFMATVPQDGVLAGEIFETLHPSVLPSHTNAVGMSAPKWRTGLCDACDCDKRDSCSLCCMAFFCALLVHAQIMERLNLNLGGCRRHYSTGSNHRRIGACVLFPSITGALFVLMIIFSILGFFLGVGLVYLAFLGWFIFMFVAMVCTRKSMREHYKLPGACCIDGDCVDDFCVTSWCACCSAIQMARQTHDARLHRYDCCSSTGLGRDAPPCENV